MNRLGKYVKVKKPIFHISILNREHIRLKRINLYTGKNMYQKKIVLVRD